MSDKEQIDEAFGRDGRAFSLFKQDFRGQPSFVVEERDASGNVVRASGFDNESDARNHVKDQQGAFFMQPSRSTVPATGDNKPNNASAPNPATTPIKEATEPAPGSQNGPETNTTPKQDI